MLSSGYGPLGNKVLVSRPLLLWNLFVYLFFTVVFLSGRELAGDALQTGEGWAGFAAGFLTGGLSGVVWAYFTLTQGWAYFS